MSQEEAQQESRKSAAAEHEHDARLKNLESDVHDIKKAISDLVRVSERLSNVTERQEDHEKRIRTNEHYIAQYRAEGNAIQNLETRMGNVEKIQQTWTPIASWGAKVAALFTAAMLGAAIKTMFL
ncbi:hypothetical protein [Thiohalorhabdus sp.]|uniref:hypothetical protein n=1 Tax=Thiohalorhabdus sp. TaxID=3094134 RepID=UPI002FC345CA